MKKIYLFFLLIASVCNFAQNGAPAAPYYNGFNWTLSGMALKTALSTSVISKHVSFLAYYDVWNADKITDLNPNNSANVLLIYGWEAGIDADVTNDYSRAKDNNGGNNGEWNREHVYAKSLGSPILDDSGSSDAGEDAHHLRSSDVQRNNARGNLKFAAGSGTSKSVVGGWYPGEEWKGDVARMMMYMYLRYGTQCLPTAVGTGTTVMTDANMPNLFLQWNAEDPVSQYEDNRNTYHGNSSNNYAQGNRNPFIDNPYLATVIWGGPIAQNRWPNYALSTITADVFSGTTIYPNPVDNHKLNIETNLEIDEIALINGNGQLIQMLQNPVLENNKITLDNLPQGFYLLKLTSENQSITRKIIVN